MSAHGTLVPWRTLVHVRQVTVLLSPLWSADPAGAALCIHADSSGKDMEQLVASFADVLITRKRTASPWTVAMSKLFHGQSRRLSPAPTAGCRGRRAQRLSRLAIC